MERPIVYAVWHNDENIRAASRSGGIFTALSDALLARDGVVYGCVLDDAFRAVHKRTESAGGRNRMRGSKYIQSHMGDTLKDVENDLKNGREVLFSGTSCQVTGLREYLSARDVTCEKLVCVDIVCHGVPSPKVWNAYLKWQSDRAKSKIINVDFRNKADYGWRAHYETLYMADGKKVTSQVFTILFYRHNILRPCCYNCKWKCVIHPGDITIADYWGIEKAAPEFDDDKGTSMVFVNSEKGNALFESVKKDLHWKQTQLVYDDLQTPLKEPFAAPDSRECFWKDFIREDFDSIAKQYGEFGIKYRIYKFARKQVGRAKRLVKKLVITK